jgi:hypothetical protein
MQAIFTFSCCYLTENDNNRKRRGGTVMDLNFIVPLINQALVNTFNLTHSPDVA